MSNPRIRGKSYFHRGRWVPLVDMPEIIPYCVYVIESDYGVKIGISGSTTSEARRLSLEQESGMPMRIVREYPYSSRYDAYADEQAAHAALAETRTIGEWFHCHPFEATDVLERIRHSHRKAVAA